MNKTHPCKICEDAQCFKCPFMLWPGKAFDAYFNLNDE